jgi:hypothetical protein
VPCTFLCLLIVNHSRAECVLIDSLKSIALSDKAVNAALNTKPTVECSPLLVKAS